MKIRALRSLRGDYGHLTRGEVAVVADDVAKKLIKRGSMEEVGKSVPLGLPGRVPTGKAAPKPKAKRTARSKPVDPAPTGSPTSGGEPSSSSDQGPAPDGTAPSSPEQGSGTAD